MGNYAQHVKGKLLESIQSLETLKEMFVLHRDKDFTETFDIDVHKCLTRKQTKEIKAHPKKYHFLPKDVTFDFLDLHTNLFMIWIFGLCVLKSQKIRTSVSLPIWTEMIFLPIKLRNCIICAGD